MKIVAFDLNLLFLRYVVYDESDRLHERVFFQLPWTRLESLIGKHEVVK